MIFDLPDAIVQARDRLAGSKFSGRVTLAAGDFYSDELPRGADLAWISAIVHQHSRRHNRDLFGKVHRALEPGGWIAIRDIVMEPNRTQPAEGALFAVNMLVNTESGGTFTFEEFVEDLKAAGFVEPKQLRAGRRADGDDLGGRGAKSVRPLMKGLPVRHTTWILAFVSCWAVICFSGCSAPIPRPRLCRLKSVATRRTLPAAWWIMAESRKTSTLSWRRNLRRPWRRPTGAGRTSTCRAISCPSPFGFAATATPPST